MGHEDWIMCGRKTGVVVECQWQNPIRTLSQTEQKTSATGGESVMLSSPSHRWRCIMTGRKRKEKHHPPQEKTENAESILIPYWRHYRAPTPGTGGILFSTRLTKCTRHSLALLGRKDRTTRKAAPRRTRLIWDQVTLTSDYNPGANNRVKRMWHT